MTSATEPRGHDLDVRTALLEAAEARRTADQQEARLLALAVQIVHLHPVDETTCTATWNPLTSLDEETGAGLAGTGTPLVAERAVEELGAALDISYRSALGLVTDALELSYRLPRLWALVQAGVLQAWKARKVAQQTTHLGAEAVAFVDAQAAIAGGKNRITANLAGLVHEALIRFEPEKARAREEAAQTHREVRFDYHGETTGCPGSATLTAELDLVDGLDLDTAVTDLADHLGRLGDDPPLDERRARALGLLAHPQASPRPRHPPRRAHRAPNTATASRPGRGWRSGRPAPPAVATLFLHLDADDLRRHTQDGDLTPGTVEKLGTASLDLIATWLGRTNGITLKPVLDMNRSDAVDRTTHQPGCVTSSPSATATASSPAAPSTPDAATKTTSSPTSLSTRADHPARPHRRTWLACVDDTTGSRPSPAGTTNAPDPAPTPGPTHTASPTRADPPPSTDSATGRPAIRLAPRETVSASSRSRR